MDCFDIQKGWTTVEEDGYGDFNETDLLAAGFDLFTNYGSEACRTTGLAVWAHQDGRFIVLIDTFSSWRAVLATNLPSLIELLRLLSPMAALGITADLAEIVRELHDLLVNYGSGPLESPLLDRAAQQRRRAQERKTKRTEAPK